MGIFHFPSNFVYWENIENHEKIKSVLMNKVLELDQGRFKNYKTSGIINATTNFQKGDDFYKCIDDEILTDLVWKPLDNLLSKLNSKPNCPNIELTNSFIISGWYTKYDTNGLFKLHSHYEDRTFYNGKIYKPTFSMIYILNDDNDQNSTKFTIPYGAPLSILPRQEFSYDTAYNEEIKEGSIIIFPSSLYHEVSPVKIPGRITIAFNIASNFVNDT
jgi:hypothetical protein